MAGWKIASSFVGFVSCLKKEQTKAFLMENAVCVRKQRHKETRETVMFRIGGRSVQQFYFFQLEREKSRHGGDKSLVLGHTRGQGRSLL